MLAEPMNTTNVSAQWCPGRGGCSCDCSWASAAACSGPGDGSCCYGCCCGGPSPRPTPPPSPPWPPSPPAPPAPGGWSAERLIVVNRCNQPMWIASTPNVPGARSVKVEGGQTHRFSIPLGGLASTRFWPKMGCDGAGQRCAIGDSGGPGQTCKEGGCAPPVDSKFEATFGPVGTPCGPAQNCDWWNPSAVDGFTVPFKIEVDATCPKGVTVDGSQISLQGCPTSDNIGSVGYQDLRVFAPGHNSMSGCYSPCAKLTFSNWNNTVGRHQAEDPIANMYCCPTPPISSEQCRHGPVEQTSYVKYIHKAANNVYAYAYDDGVGLQTCPAGTKYTWSLFCPGGSQPSPPSPSSCKDEDPRCGTYPRSYCLPSSGSHYAYSKWGCRKTCGFCHGTSLNGTETHRAVDEDSSGFVPEKGYADIVV